jgi:hypothetical protein
MASDSEKMLARRDPHADALVLGRVPQGTFPLGFFCASPTVLEAINFVLQQRGLPTLWVQPDGTIGPTDPLLMTVEFVPSPFFVC